MSKTYTIGDKQYSKEQLVAFGKEHYPKFYWIARGVGILLLFVGLIVMGMIGIVLIILNAVGVFKDPDFPTWAFYIPLGVFGLIFLAGLICIILSFVGRSEQKYLNHALAYLTKCEARGQNVETLLSQKQLDELARNERLLKGGVITQEEFDRRKEELIK